MTDSEKMALAAAAMEGSLFAEVMDEGIALAITASYLAGKEAGKREAHKDEANIRNN